MYDFYEVLVRLELDCELMCLRRCLGLKLLRISVKPAQKVNPIMVMNFEHHFFTKNKKP